MSICGTNVCRWRLISSHAVGYVYVPQVSKTIFGNVYSRHEHPPLAPDRHTCSRECLFPQVTKKTILVTFICGTNICRWRLIATRAADNVYFPQITKHHFW